MKTLTIAYITARKQPHIEWFFDSLQNQTDKEFGGIPVVVVDSYQGELRNLNSELVKHVRPKPNVWQGENRLTKQDWWAVSNARNTALCLCNTDWIVWVDDRCVLMTGWLDAVRAAMKGEYAVCGNYEKRHSMTVENGVIQNGGIITGKDARESHGLHNCYGQFWGGTYATPTEWALNINGWEELVDGLGAEDYIFGFMLCNAGYMTKYDPALKIVEDRTPGESGPDMKKTDKGVSPKDKSHAALDKFGGLKRAIHPWDIRQIRESVLKGEPFPGIEAFPKEDWYDGQPIEQFD